MISQGPVITLKPCILIFPMPFCYIKKKTVIFAVTFSPLHFQSVPEEDGKKMDSINIPLRSVAFSSTNFHINLLRSLLYKHNPFYFALPHSCQPSLLLLFPEEHFIFVLWLVSQLLGWCCRLLGLGPGTELKVADIILVIVCNSTLLPPARTQDLQHFCPT